MVPEFYLWQQKLCLSLWELASKERMATVPRLGACGVKTGFQAEARPSANAESVKRLHML